MINAPVERFPSLDEIGTVVHGFVLRTPGLDVQTDRENALQRLSKSHREVIRDFGSRELRLAEQIHGNGVAIVTVDSLLKSPKADALVTADPGVLLGIYVADCCAVYLVDTRNGAIGLAHSGRKGTGLNVAGATLRTMRDRFGTEPGNVVAQLSPCIRPPYYEIDFAAQIVRDLQAAAVGKIVDSGENTGSDLNRFYSYRMEKGRTGRMLALLALERL